MLDLSVRGKLALRGGHIVDTVVEGTVHKGRLKGQWNIEGLDRHDPDEELSVGLPGSLLSSNLLDLFRVLILINASASVTIEWHGN